MSPFEQAWEEHKAKFPHTLGWQNQECFAAGWDAALKVAERTALNVVDRAFSVPTFGDAHGS